MNQILFIPDIFKEVASRVSAATQLLDDPFRVYFEYGHYRDVVKRLDQKEGAILEDTRTKYPLIYMVTDFEEKRTDNTSYYCELPSLQFIVAMGTDNNYTMDERRDKTYLPRLYPVYAEFLKQLSKTKALGYPNEGTLTHTKIDRSYWAGDEGQNANMFNDYIDAIQIKGMNLRVKATKQNC